MFGYLIESEVESLDKVVKEPKRPLTAIMGGAKVSSKITIIENLLNKVDNLILGGGMTYTFVKANGGKVGDSICEDDFLETAKNIEKLAKEKGVNLVIASDVIAANNFSNDANTKVIAANAIPDGWQGLDAGPASIAKMKEVIENSGTILWNGPVGVFEMETFAGGSKAIGTAIVEATKKGAFSLVGGGDSVACVNQFGFAEGVSYISTAGGALLEYLEGKVLPGVAAVRGE
jgi:phosphoglycerate kinase